MLRLGLYASVHSINYLQHHHNREIGMKPDIDVVDIMYPNETDADERMGEHV